ncbi:MAG: LSU ribosomal protein L23p (L23Ae) [uncultured Thermomicrobiales bacterium]|jgi:large subunit ribosomal protein L23|uniref:Large ribosomal subunit protein uL23 n=1 Tax=uncultured Thermomicrobiales bacterium TaxID=1645740 RepID=A0A6J4VI18_9BACT|nr:MAG: LSU ribosomal protein L23p (L23Ae) [uncultured Thermomicrobiales bacterium]
MAALAVDDVIRRPVITEKNTLLMESDQYTFEVAIVANKIQIREAVEKLFNVRVKAVNTLIVKAKPKSRAIRRGRGRVHGHESSWKKAIVTLYPGQRIDIFEQV